MSVSRVYCGHYYQAQEGLHANICPKPLLKTTDYPGHWRWGGIVLKQLAHALPCTNSFLGKRQSPAPARVVSPSTVAHMALSSFCFLSSWVSRDYFPPHWPVNGPLLCICHHQADFGLCKAPNTHFSHDERQKQSWGAGEFSLMGVHVLCTETWETRGTQGYLLALPPSKPFNVKIL